MGDNPAQLRSELNEKIKEISNLRNELERVKKDKSITSGLVTQMQRDMSSKVSDARSQCSFISELILSSISGIWN